MKTCASLLMLVVVLFGCNDDSVTKDCGTPATARDLTSVDGCGYAFELSDGTLLIPVFDVLYCGTPPLPKEVTEDPLYNFQFTEGRQVVIGYELRPDVATGCMGGKAARITCLEATEPTE
ncbi:hypothetical protein WBG78_29415 [Chryseolinea sp. T2]|uniref:hypothetical protein n=1 Tax=Chryseolinea sp. T2 TaxID=3129255 RepID=UPI00307782E6